MSRCPLTAEPCGRLDCDPPQDCAEGFRFPNRPLIPSEPAVFDDRSLLRKGHGWHRPVSDCPWAWTLTACATVAVLGLLTRGHLW
jgi:hypothetical protein